MICPICKTEMKAMKPTKVFVGKCPSCGLHLDQIQQSVSFEEDSPQWCKDSLQFMYDFQKYHPSFAFSQSDLFTPKFDLSHVIFITDNATDGIKERVFNDIFSTTIVPTYKLIGGQGYLKWGLVDLVRSVFVHKDPALYSDAAGASPFALMLLRALWSTYSKMNFNIDEVVVINAMLRRTFDETCQDLFQCMPGNKVLPMVTDEEAIYSVIFNNFPMSAGLVANGAEMRKRMENYALGILAKALDTTYEEAHYVGDNEPANWQTNDKLRFDLWNMYLTNTAGMHLNNHGVKKAEDVVSFDIVDGDYKNTPFVDPMWKTCNSSIIQKLIRGYRNLNQCTTRPELPFSSMGVVGKKAALEDMGVSTEGRSNNWIVFTFWRKIAIAVLKEHDIA